MDGEELLGAKQNRIVNLTILVAANSELTIPVSCVEAGRWRARSRAFTSAPRTQFVSGRAKRMCDWANTVFVDALERADPALTALPGARGQGRRIKGFIGRCVHHHTRVRLQRRTGRGRGEDRALHQGGSRCRPPQVQRLPHPHAKEEGPHCSYASALEELNIPVEVSGAGAFGESAEVETLTALLRALSDPQDALPLVAVLRGPLFGIERDPELFAFKQAGGWFSIFFEASDAGSSPVDVGRVLRPGETARVPVGDVGRALRPGDTRVADALATLHRCYRWTRMLPAAAALDRIFEHTGYLALAATTPGGVEAGDLLHALDHVRQVAEDGGSLGDAADALAADSEASNEVESLPLEPAAPTSSG